MSDKINIAIDGPASAGKSTIAKRLAKELNYIYVDTGAMYRAIALFLSKEGIDGADEKGVSAAVPGAKITIEYSDGTQHVILNGEDVTGSLRSEQVGNMASVTSSYPAVRQHLMELQRQLARENNVVMDGRDIGTVILPDANVKVYLTASASTRAKRRFDELVEKGQSPDLEEIKADIEERDRRDMTREISPLKKAEDAVEVDSSDMTIDEVVDRIKELAENGK